VWVCVWVFINFGQRFPQFYDMGDEHFLVPNFAPSMQNRIFFYFSAYMYLVVFYVGENSLFFGKKSMRFKSGDPLDIFFYTKRQF
jgi:hypothetical protein